MIVRAEGYTLDDRILALLERFSQMTRPLLQFAGVDANADYLGERLLRLHDGRLVHCTRPGVRGGKVPYVYSLARAGAERLAELWKKDRDDLHYYGRKPQIGAAEFAHRCLCVAAHVSAARRFGEGLAAWIPAYGRALPDGAPPTLLRVAKGRAIRPDALFVIDRGEPGRMACALEVLGSDDLQRGHLADLLESHRQAWELRLVSSALGVRRDGAGVRDFLSLIAVPDEAMLERWSGTLEQHAGSAGFVCTTHGTLRRGFSEWRPLLTKVDGQDLETFL